jgi:transcriptional regulator with XRE-family HTH domain
MTPNEFKKNWHNNPTLTVLHMTPQTLKEWRTNIGFTQEQAAKVLGFKNRSSICLLENGKRPITLLIQLACHHISDVIDDYSYFTNICPHCDNEY